MQRPSGRSIDAIRNVEILTHVNKHAEGSCLVKFSWGVLELVLFDLQSSFQKYWSLMKLMPFYSLESVEQNATRPGSAQVIAP